MSRFCGRLDWERAAPHGGATWPPMLALLGDHAVDCSPAGDPRVRLGLWSPEQRRPPARHLAADAEAAVLFSGYFRDPAPPPTGEAQAVLDRYRAGDWHWLRRANGVFAFAIVDWHRARCVLATDRLGIRPLFFLQNEASLAFAEDLGTVAACRVGSSELDYDTLQELMALGFPLGTRTFLRDVERVPPGTWIDFATGRRHTTRYWSLEALPAVKQQDVTAFLDESQARLRSVLSQLLSRTSRAVCLLSSGYD